MAATPRTEDAEGVAAPHRWRLRAFGLEIDSSFEAPGLPAASGRREGPSTRLDLCLADEIERDRPRGAPGRGPGERFDDGPPARTIDVHPRRGYRLYARHFGLA